MNFKTVFKTEVQRQLIPLGNIPLLSDTDIQRLPSPVQRYLHFTNAVDKPRVKNFRAVFNGQMKRSPKSAWLPIRSTQYNFYDEKVRLFYIQSKMFGIPFDGLHSYIGKNATMKIKLASLFTVADAKGEKMNQSETVTLFNDMCLMAPATLIDRNIQWETIDSRTVRARFTNNDITISAILYFNESGALTNFTSEDRYLSADGKTYERYKWFTPVKSYKEFEGRKVCGEADAVWHMPDGPYVYANFKMEQVEFNCTKFK